MNDEPLLEVLDRIPPYLCRFLATKGRGHKFKTHSDIASESGLPRATVVRISTQKSWARVQVGKASAFAKACGINLLRPKKVRAKLARSKRCYIKNSKGRQRELIVRLMTQVNG